MLKPEVCEINFKNRITNSTVSASSPQHCIATAAKKHPSPKEIKTATPTAAPRAPTGKNFKLFISDSEDSARSTSAAVKTKKSPPKPIIHGPENCATKGSAKKPSGRLKKTIALTEVTNLQPKALNNRRLNNKSAVKFCEISNARLDSGNSVKYLRKAKKSENNLQPQTASAPKKSTDKSKSAPESRKTQEAKNGTSSKDRKTQKWVVTDFEYGRCLGKGRFGNTYLAREKRSGYVIAIKMISKAKIRDGNIEHLIQREVEIHTQLRYQWRQLKY